MAWAWVIPLRSLLGSSFYWAREGAGRLQWIMLANNANNYKNYNNYTTTGTTQLQQLQQLQ